MRVQASSAPSVNGKAAEQVVAHATRDNSLAATRRKYKSLRSKCLIARAQVQLAEEKANASGAKLH